ncbi:hypothetical protein D3C86_1310450 [compost metagenome]
MLCQIGNDHHILPGDDTATDRHVTRAFRELHARLFRDMKPILVNDVDGRPGHAENTLPQLRQHFQFRHVGILEGHDRPHRDQTLHFPVRS